MNKLIEALHVIQETCKKQECDCEKCPLSAEFAMTCCVTDKTPDMWKINDEVRKALL